MTIDTLLELSQSYAIVQENSPIPNLFVLRRDKVSEIEAVVYNPVVCLILQGAKKTRTGNTTVELAVGDALLVSHDAPVTSKITSASVETPYLALILSIDLGLLRQLYERVGSHLDKPPAQAFTVGAADPAWIDPLTRYAALQGNALDTEVLGPAILKEVHYRLLMSPIGGMLRHLISVDSHASRIALTIQHIRRDFDRTLAVPMLAKAAGMSTSSFHTHFKAVTGMTPLQYQKDLRMIAARDLLLGGQHTVTQTAFAVGYESPTHFSRDYVRKFDLAPSAEARAARMVA